MNRLMNLIKVIFPVVTFLIILTFAAMVQAQDKDNLAEEVTAAITSKYPPSNVNVSVKVDGWVTLTGQADLLYDKDMMYQIASHIPGVKRITNDIRIVPKTVPGDKDPDIMPDNILKQNVKSLIMENPDIKEPEKIEVSVDNALVTLSGKVHFYKEKIIASTAASQVKGVNAVDNNLTVIPLKNATSDKDIRDVLLSVLDKDFPLVNRDKINLKVDNGEVTVWGTVSNLWIKDSIEKEFSSIEGVKGVINNLNVKPDMKS